MNIFKGKYKFYHFFNIPTILFTNLIERLEKFVVKNFWYNMKINSVNGEILFKIYSNFFPQYILHAHCLKVFLHKILASEVFHHVVTPKMIHHILLHKLFTTSEFSLPSFTQCPYNSLFHLPTSLCQLCMLCKMIY